MNEQHPPVIKAAHAEQAKSHGFADLDVPPAQRVHGDRVRVHGASERPLGWDPSNAALLDKGRTHLSAEPFELPELDYEVVHPLGPVRGDDKTTWTAEEMEALKDSWSDEWQGRLDDAVAQTRETAFDEGYAAATEALRAEVDETRKALTEEIEALATAHETLFKRAEPMIVELAFSIAEGILAAPLPERYRDISERVIAEAIDSHDGAEVINVTLHPVSYLRLQEGGIVDQLDATHSKLRWHPSSECRLGEWVVDSPVSSTRRLEHELLAMMKEELGVVGKSPLHHPHPSAGAAEDRPGDDA